MACLIQPECNFLHGYFRCRLLVEVVDVEIKITSMQGTHIFRWDRTTQLIKCTPWNTRLCPHPTIIKKMKTFLEVEGRMGPIPIPTNQFRPPQPDTNPNVRMNNASEKRKRAVPKKFRPSAAPKPNADVPLPATVSKPPANVKPKTDVPENRPPPLEYVPVCKSTPWPGTGKMSGNLFEDRNWLLPPNYLDNENKNTTGITSPRPLYNKRRTQGKWTISRKIWMATRLPLLWKSGEGGLGWQTSATAETSPQPKIQKPQARCPKTLNLPTDKYPSQTKIKQQWEAEMEKLNSKYKLDCFSDSELG